MKSQKISILQVGCCSTAQQACFCYLIILWHLLSCPPQSAIISSGSIRLLWRPFFFAFCGYYTMDPQPTRSWDAAIQILTSCKEEGEIIFITRQTSARECAEICLGAMKGWRSLLNCLPCSMWYKINAKQVKLRFDQTQKKGGYPSKKKILRDRSQHCNLDIKLALSLCPGSTTEPPPCPIKRTCWRVSCLISTNLFTSENRSNTDPEQFHIRLILRIAFSFIWLYAWFEESRGGKKHIRSFHWTTFLLN